MLLPFANGFRSLHARRVKVVRDRRLLCAECESSYADVTGGVDGLVRGS